MDVQKRQQFNAFFKQHEQSAFKMSVALVKSREDALEIVQDSMLKLVQKYAQKPSEEWTLLFYRIVQNKVRDHQRKCTFKSFFQVFSTNDDSIDDKDIEPSSEQTPDECLQSGHGIKAILKALTQLPLRQKQTFILRAWQEFSVKETAFTLSISEGSVKTHYSRALQQLRTLLGEHYEKL